jgi:hypothetical protein
LGNEQPLLAELYGASVAGRVATGPKAGRPLIKIGDDVDLEELGYISGPRCASISGVNVHANVGIAAHEKMRLERLFRYAPPPPVATSRLSGLPDGRLLQKGGRSPLISLIAMRNLISSPSSVNRERPLYPAALGSDTEESIN